MRTIHKQKPELQAFARHSLLQRQRALTSTREHADDEARELYETPETDWEDRAANVTAASGLERLGDKERAELRLVTEALERLDEGRWGTCVSCGAPIAERRLRAAPEAARCAQCSDHVEA